MFFFYFYIFSVLVLGSFVIGPASIRVYMTVLMMIYLFINRHKDNKRHCQYKISKKILWIFLIFILFSAFALILNGEYSEYDFNKLFLAYYLNCFVSYLAIDYFIIDSKRLKNFIWVLILIIDADAIVTILQFVGNPIGNLIAMSFTTITEIQSNIVGASSSYGIGANLPIGFFGHIFTNGTMLACLGLLCICQITDNDKLVRLGGLSSLLLCLYASFVTQQRAAFVLFLLMTLFLFIIGPFSKRSKSLVVGGIIAATLLILPDLILSDKLGRIAMSGDRRDDTRADIWSFCIDFLKDHLLLGAPVTYYKRTDAAPHNFFLFVLINFGLMGSLIIIYQFFLMTLQGIKSLLSKYSYTTKTLAATVCVYNAVSLFHNASIATGDTIIFILFPLMLKSLVFDKADITSIPNYGSHKVALF